MTVRTERALCGVILSSGKRKGEPCDMPVVPDAIPLTCRRHQTHGPTGQFGLVKREAFLEAYRNSGNIRRSCEAAGIVRQTYANWLDADPSLIVDMLAARQDAIEALEGAMRDMAMDGNVTAGIFLLKSLVPERYRETMNANLHVDTGLPSGSVDMDTAEGTHARLLEHLRSVRGAIETTSVEHSE